MDLKIDVPIFTCKLEGLSWSWSYGRWIYNYLCNRCLSPLMLWVRIPLRRGVFDTTLWLCDKVCQWLLPGTPVSSTNKTDRHDITEIVLKVALNIITTRPHVTGNYHKRSITKIFLCQSLYSLVPLFLRNQQNWRDVLKWVLRFLFPLIIIFNSNIINCKLSINGHGNTYNKPWNWNIINTLQSPSIILRQIHVKTKLHFHNSNDCVINAK